MNTINTYAIKSAGSSNQYWRSDGSGAGAWTTPASEPASGSNTLITAGAVYDAIEEVKTSTGEGDWQIVSSTSVLKSCTEYMGGLTENTKQFNLRIKLVKDLMILVNNSSHGGTLFIPKGTMYDVPYLGNLNGMYLTFGVLGLNVPKAVYIELTYSYGTSFDNYSMSSNVYLNSGSGATSYAIDFSDSKSDYDHVTIFYRD